MKNNSQAFVNQLLVCLLVTMTAGGSLGLGTVWLRHQNSLMAKANSALAARIAAVDRSFEEKNTQVETEERPDLLRKLNKDLALGLVPMNQVDVINVPDNVTDRLVERANRALLSADRAVVAFPGIKVAAR